jgi:undecaprenyl-diphosphatase
MNAFDAVLLGIIQGLTEFLPISSTAHLTLAGKLMGLITSDTAEAWTAFIAIIQLGTLLAVTVYFLKELRLMCLSLARDVKSLVGNRMLLTFSTESRLGIYLVLGTVPIGIAGLFLNKFIHGMFTKSTVVIIASLVALAVLLWIAERVASHARTLDQLNWRDALAIGIAQVLALIPGSSRSGTTITAGLFLNLSRPAAARFSFLLSIPAVFASGLYELTKVSGGAMHFGMLNLVIATLMSAMTGYAAIAWLLRYLSSHTTLAFVWYRIGLGVLLTLLLLLNLLQF